MSWGACALRKPDGKLVCWGLVCQDRTNNCTGGSVIVYDNPPLTSLRGTWVNICGLTADNMVVCYGRNTTNPGAGPGSFTESLIPPASGGIGPVTTFTTGSFHACAVLRSTGLTTCWGSLNQHFVNLSPPSGLGYATKLTSGGAWVCAVRTSQPMGARRVAPSLLHGLPPRVRGVASASSLTVGPSCKALAQHRG